MEKPPRRNHFHTNNSGFTLVGVLMVLVVLSVLGLSILMITSNSVKLSAGERDDQSVFYIAEAGLTVEMDEIEGQIQSTYSNTNDANSFFNELFQKIIISGKYSSTSFEKTLGEITPKAKIDVVEQNSGNPTRLYKLTSTGIIDKKSRVVEREFSVTWVPKSSGFGEMAIIMKEDIILNGKVVGDIATLKKGVGSVQVDWAGNEVFFGEIYVPPGYEQSAISRKDWMKFNPVVHRINTLPEFILPRFPSIPTYPNSNKFNYISLEYGDETMKLDGNSTMGKLIVSGSHKLTIDVGDSDKELVLDELDLGGSGVIFIRGKGKLKLYIKNKLNITNGMLNPQTLTEKLEKKVDADNISEDHLRKLEIYYKGSNTFSVSSNLKIYASIYTETANVSITSSSSIFGNILSGGRSFKVTGNGNVQPSLYFAPNADFEVSGSGKVYGSIIGKSINIFGGGEVHYKSPLLTDGSLAPGFGSSGEVEIVKKAEREK
ncbi:PilX N-terminal domain-containing pilus assembly protein [Sporosarcina sp. SG10008]|uniref:PilX N-terminal domain-containing pilus assembly protein n=1 Tax=Sporosarcina sp. SG10008 TaxID=3373103 RepID=UPI0037DBF77F